MLDHHALGLAGRAAGVDHVSQPFRGQRGGQRRGRGLARGERGGIDHAIGGEPQRRHVEPGEAADPGGIGQHGGRGGILDDLAHALGREGGVEAGIGGAGLEHGELDREVQHRGARQQQRNDRLVRVWRRRGRQPRDEVARDPVGEGVERGIGDRLALGPPLAGRHVDRHGGAMPRGAGAQESVERASRCLGDRHGLSRTLCHRLPLARPVSGATPAPGRRAPSASMGLRATAPSPGLPTRPRTTRALPAGQAHCHGTGRADLRTLIPPLRRIVLLFEKALRHRPQRRRGDPADRPVFLHLARIRSPRRAAGQWCAAGSAGCTAARCTGRRPRCG